MRITYMNLYIFNLIFGSFLLIGKRMTARQRVKYSVYDFSQSLAHSNVSKLRLVKQV